ncbi:hypothetical protein KY290_006070 [Solanum tuberosum]|uniref:Uncharacterized protein n=1 Tax=Solanum tuberosum TaxID=4113 RepID=A0ABQ7WG04_SOLTU|nr:hypothetical protein KY284_006183 [Solanum tuberosum]KAH0779643.1 hypothetical protein KY290_006070 [Solanum tuberosum]
MSNLDIESKTRICGKSGITDKDGTVVGRNSYPYICSSGCLWDNILGLPSGWHPCQPTCTKVDGLQYKIKNMFITKEVSKFKPKRKKIGPHEAQ